LKKTFLLFLPFIILVIPIIMETACAYSYEATFNQLSNDSERDLNPVWSPDGKSIVFNKEYRLYAIDIETLEEDKLETGFREAFCPKFSPDGSTLLFEARNKLYVMDTKNDTVEPLFQQEIGYSSAYSPEGDQVAYFTKTLRETLAVGDSEGEDRECILSLVMLKPFQITWSPDSEKIMFSSGPPEKRVIQMIYSNGSSSVNGSDLKFLAEGNIVHQTQSWQSQSWSPDGSEIVFFRRENNYTTEIYTVDSDGQNIKKLTNNTVDDYFPSYSPDGKHIIFVSKIAGNEDIWIMDKNGNNITQLTQNTGNDYNPVWGPDGTKLAFVSETDGQTDIWLMEITIENNTSTKIATIEMSEEETIIETSETTTNADENIQAAKHDIKEEIDESSNSTENITEESPVSIFTTIISLLLGYGLLKKRPGAE